jgi:transposase
MQQQALIDIPEQPEQKPLAELPPQPPADTTARLKLRVADRSKLVLTAIALDDALPADHKARAIVALLERVDTSAFYSGIRTLEGKAGRAMRDPKTMIAVILYAYSEGIGSMREVSAMTEYHPALMWITGLDAICHTELSEFRREQKAGLGELFASLLAVLDKARVINLDQVAVDGTRIRTFAGVDTFRRGKTIERKLEQARELVRKMESGEQQEEYSARQLRAQQELIERLEACQRELEKIQQGKAEGEAEARVSTTEPEARVMKTSQGGYVPAYNTQLMTESQSKAIVNVEVTNVSSDGQHLGGALEQVEETTGQMPKQVLADGAYISEENVRKAGEHEVDLVGPWPDTTAAMLAGLKATGIDAAFAPNVFVWEEARKVFVCPAGKELAWWKKHSKDRSRVYDCYRAQPPDCASCGNRDRCVQVKLRQKGEGRQLHVLRQSALVVAHRAKMATQEAKEAYRKRGEVAEFPNAWLKEKLGLRKFRLRGLAKAGIEALWACLAYDVAIWRRHVWLPELQAAA